MKARVVYIDRKSPDAVLIRKAGELLLSGGLVAFPTETVYGLGGNALDKKSAKKIYAAKGRPCDNPLIVHISSWTDLKKIAAFVPDKAKALGQRFWPGPLTMIFEKTQAVPKEVTGGLDTVAVRFPSHEVARALIRASGGFVAAPSANLSGRPSPTKASHVVKDLGDKIDMIIDSGSADIGLESTIVDFTSDPPLILRPGFLNDRQIEALIGKIDIDTSLIEENSGIVPKAPGMKYRHYAPSGELLIVEGNSFAVTDKINALIRDKASSGLRTAVLCREETKNSYRAGRIIPLGSIEDESAIAAGLYDALRSLDDEGTDYIYSEEFNTEGIGKAIMNRLLKAAGHKVIRV